MHTITMFSTTSMILISLMPSIIDASNHNLRGLTVNDVVAPKSYIGECFHNVCTAGDDFTVESIEETSGLTTCVAGSKIKVSVDATISTSVEAYDFGVFLGMNGTAQSGQCAIAPLIEKYASSYLTSGTGEISWTKDSIGGNDVCGDIIPTKGTGSSEIDEVTTTLTMTNLFRDVEIDCTADEHGKLILPLCFSWQSTTTDASCDPNVLVPGMSSNNESTCYCETFRLCDVVVTTPPPDIDDCEDNVTEKTINVGSNKALVSATKSVHTKRLSLPKNEEIRFDYVTNESVYAYRVPTWFDHARYKKKLSYTFEDAAFVNACYDYDIVLGFAELDPAYCTGAPDEPDRIMDVIVNSGGEDVVVRSGLNVVEQTGGQCYQGYIIKTTVKPTSTTITVMVSSDTEAILSYIKIKRSTNRRLGADCNQKQNSQK